MSTPQTPHTPNTPHTGQTTYFETLSTALRTAGVPQEQITATVAELTGHLAETGTDPEDEFGPAEAFAAQLGGSAPSTGKPAEEAQTWTWTADIYNDRKQLAHFGDQGWEVERLDGLGRFVCRRVPGAALRWEYRREVMAGRRRAEVLERLTPEGWEICGEWMVYAYFKRTKAASEGPAAALDTLPERPKGRLFLSDKGRWMLAAWAALTLALVALSLAGAIDLPGYAVACAMAGGMAGAAYGIKRDIDKGCEG